MKALGQIPWEFIFWITALGLLAIAEPHPYGTPHHYTLCPLANLGVDWCPGCGIGRSISQLLHGNVAESWRYHWFGIPAVLIISYRIGILAKLSVNNYKGLKLKYKEESDV
jgi:hypothetical protein